MGSASAGTPRSSARRAGPGPVPQLRDIRRMSARISGATAGRPGARGCRALRGAPEELRWAAHRLRWLAVGADGARSRRMGVVVPRRTDSATLPRRSRPRPLRPWVGHHDLVDLPDPGRLHDRIGGGAVPDRRLHARATRLGEAVLEGRKVVFRLPHDPDLGLGEIGAKQCRRLGRPQEEHAGARHVCQLHGLRESRLGQGRAVEGNEDRADFMSGTFLSAARSRSEAR